MGNYESSAIRNLAFVGHGGSGKTTLGETLLKLAGIVTRVPAGVLDFSSDEKERQHSIESKIAHFSWKSKEINFIDVPGYQEFFQNVVSSLSVVETAVLVISASDGITINTRRAWNVAQKNGLAKFIVITKLDNENANFNDMVAQIQSTFGSHCIPFVIPDVSGLKFSKVHHIFDPSTPNGKQYKDKLIEATVETSDELLNRYLEGESIAEDVIQKQLKEAIIRGQIIPIIASSPTKEIGLAELLDVILEYAPSPLDVPKKKAKTPSGEEVILEPTKNAPFAAQIFKIFNDPFGRIVYFRVYSGTLSTGTSIYDINLGDSERVGNIFRLLGKDQKNIDCAVPGDIVGIAKVENVQLGHTLGPEKGTFKLSESTYPMPMVSLAVNPKTRGDEQKIGASLNKLAEEDKTFLVTRDADTNELVVSGMSNLHLDIMLNRLRTRFKVDCTQAMPHIPYRETITGKADSRYRHKKQSGGHGQFAEVAIKLEPGVRGVGFDFQDDIVGGVVPSQFVLSTQKGINLTLQRGILAGYPIVDVRVSLYDGKTHDVDSSDAAFQMAGSKAFQEAFAAAKPVLLEPIMNIEIIVPSKFMGDIMGDLNSRRGRIVGTEADGNDQIIKALAPLAEIQAYSTQLKAMTGGEGTYSIQFSHYDVVPSYIQEKLVAKAKQEKQEQDKEKK